MNLVQLNHQSNKLALFRLITGFEIRFLFDQGRNFYKKGIRRQNDIADAIRYKKFHAPALQTVC